jgi:hypothetical protein
MRDKYTKSKAINDIIAAIKRGEFIYFLNTAEKYRCDHSALSRHIPVTALG